jgi:hypothetical protein
MNGIIQRPALSNAQVQRVGDILELRWQPRLAAQERHTRRSRKRRSDKRNLVEALVLIGVLAVLAVFTYLQSLHGAIGL